MTAVAAEVGRSFGSLRVFHGEERRERLLTPDAFLIRIGRSDLIGTISQDKPLAYHTAEFYGRGIKGQGGLGMLASDTALAAAEVGMPMIFVTPHYPQERYQRIAGAKSGGYRQEYDIVKTSPKQRDFEPVDQVTISTRAHTVVPLQVFEKRMGSVRILAVSEPNLGQLYAGQTSDDHRLYQDVALGFGGHKALKQRGIFPSMHQMNEAPTVFSAIARLDERALEVGFDAALTEVRDATLYTNHTLVPAVEGRYSYDQFEHFVTPNVANEDVKNWLRYLVNQSGGEIRLSTLALELAGRINGVSMIHAREADKTFRRFNGEPVHFDAVTNGIDLKRWTDATLLALYRRHGVIDEFGLPAENALERLGSIDARVEDAVKVRAKVRLTEVLKNRKDQYGQPVEISPDAKIFNWKRRIAGYKRPGMLFENTFRLANFLERSNSHLIIAGNAHPADSEMQEKLAEILRKVHENPVLRRRVHYIQDYDEELARPLSQGADVSINTPTTRTETGEPTSTEACATSPMKDIANGELVISTRDGFIADPAIRAEQEGRSYEPTYLEVTGETYEQEVESLYQQMERAADILDGRDSEYTKKVFLDRQRAAFLGIISGPRMVAGYVNLGYPKESAAKGTTDALLVAA